MKEPREDEFCCDGCADVHAAIRLMDERAAVEGK
jgi:hypothetical protein